ncbi:MULTISPECIES: cysteine-rich CWC family protein [unclassified Caballeronia]|uniref:cysteine-rich CWC family protein n=1 Tax=unclassified Caballeronia TaxID=2646786 RepID=UPI0020289EAF|nr:MULTISPECIES: cysteine-rich CWC family protein [unclassified Caballeronia]
MRSSLINVDDTMMNVSLQSGSDATQRCTRCGAAFHCGALAGAATCWCATLPALPRERLRPDSTCLCRACLAAEMGQASR